MFVIVVIARYVLWVIVSKVLWYYYDDFECFVHRASRRTSATSTVNSVFMHSAAGCELPWYNISLHTHWFLVAHHLSDEAWEVMTNNNLFCACQMIAAAVEEFSRFFLWAVAMYFVYQQRSHTMTTMLKLSFNFYGDNNSMYVVVLLQSSR